MGQLQYADEKEVLKELKIDKKDLLRLLKYHNPDTLWDSFAEKEGYDLAKDIEGVERFQRREWWDERWWEDRLLDVYEMEKLHEHGMAICEGKGGIYTKDFVVSKEEYKELCGEELSEFGDEKIDLSKPGFCSFSWDERVCGLDRLVGILHTHPSGAARPSFADVGSHITDRHKVMCISSPASNICWFTDPPEQAKAIPNINVGYSKYTDMAYTAEAEYMTKYGPLRDTVEILPESLTKGIDTGVLDMSIKRIYHGYLKGVCLMPNTDSEGVCYVRSKDKGVIFTRIK